MNHSLKITIIGSGYVGLVSAICFAKMGHDVTAIDHDEAKILALQKGKIPLYEPGLQAMLGEVLEADKIHFSSTLAPSKYMFIAVGTPMDEDGTADLTQVLNVAGAISKFPPKSVDYLITKSTVPVGTGDKIKLLLRKAGHGDISVCSNPEFLREGSAIQDFMSPDRIIFGGDSDRGFEDLAKLYAPLGPRPILNTSLKTSELIKYASNAFLATKLSFINELSDLCEALGANVESLVTGMGLDTRIGNAFLKVGPGYGGSCFPKDCRALIETARSHGNPLTIIEAADTSNAHRKLNLIKRISEKMGALKGKKIAILGIAFKANTDDTRDSPSLPLIDALLEAEADVFCHDPVVKLDVHDIQADQLTPCREIDEALIGADGVIIMTEWDAYRALDLKNIASMMKKKSYFFDFRNLFDPIEARSHFYYYDSFGRK